MCSNQITSVEGSGKLLTVYNPIDITRYSSGVPDSLLVEFPQLSEIINDDRLVIGQIALIQEMKCQEKVIEIAAAVRDSGRKVFAVFIGATRNGDEGYRLKLESFVEEISLSDSVLFTGFRSDVQNWLTLFDVLAIPSVEGLSLAGMEAASAGVPIFALGEGGAKELIDVSGAGMCFSNTDSHEELADKIIHCAECEQYSENGKRFARLQSFDRYRKDVSVAFRQAQGLE